MRAAALLTTFGRIPPTGGAGAGDGGTPQTPSDITSLLEDEDGGQEIIIANGEYKIRDMIIGSAGASRTTPLVLRAELRNGVKLIADNDGSTKEDHRWLLQDVHNVVLVGFEHKNIVTVFQSDVEDFFFWYPKAYYPASAHPDNLASSGTFTPSGFIFNGQDNKRIGFYGPTMGPFGDDAFRMRRAEDIEIRGAHVFGLTYDGAQSDPGYHRDGIQTVGLIAAVANSHGLIVEGSEFGEFGESSQAARQQLNVENEFGSVSALYKDVWLHDGGVTALGYAVKNEDAVLGHTLDVDHENVWVWDTNNVEDLGPNPGQVNVSKTNFNESSPLPATAPWSTWRGAAGQGYGYYKAYLGIE